MGKGGENGTERDFAWDGGHMIQYADDVLLSCTLETCMALNEYLRLRTHPQPD